LEAWESQAKCQEHDLSIFFPEDTSDPRKTKQLAVAICNSCPVRPQCLNYALVHKIEFGIWGGIDKYGRKRLAELEPWRVDGKPSSPPIIGRTEKISTKYSVGTGMKRGRIHT
jgi:WhiB family transcriptional regulator, redox-sensing transcriptional regulator